MHFALRSTFFQLIALSLVAVYFATPAPAWACMNVMVSGSPTLDFFGGVSMAALILTALWALGVLLFRDKEEIIWQGVFREFCVKVFGSIALVGLFVVALYALMMLILFDRPTYAYVSLSGKYLALFVNLSLLFFAWPLHERIRGFRSGESDGFFTDKIIDLVAAPCLLVLLTILSVKHVSAFADGQFLAPAGSIPEFRQFKTIDHI